MKKDLESIYQEAFNNDQIDAEDWNLPSDAVWDNIEEAIKPKKKRRFFWLWFPIVALTMGAYFLSKTSNNNHNKEVSQGMVQQKETITTTTITQDNNSSTKIPINAAVYHERNAFPKKSNWNRINTGTTLNSDRPIQTLEEVPKENLFTNIATDTLVLSKAIEATIQQERIAICKDVPRLTLPLLLLSASPEKNWSIPNISPELHKTNRVQIAWNAYLLNIKNQTRSTNPTAFSGESLKFAYQTGLTIRKNINKSFFVELGAQYSRLTYQLKYEMGLPFNGVGEMENNKGNYDNTYNGAVATSIGELKMQMILERQLGHSVPQGEIIPLSAEGEASISSLRLPIAFGFTKPLNHRIAVNSKVFFSQNINLTHEAKFQQVLSHHDAVKETLTEVVESPKPNAWIPEIGLGLGIEYRLTPRWSIGVEAIGINDMRYIYQNDIFKNKHRYFGGGLSVGFKL